MITLCIAGGQTGADQAGWRAAKACQIPTGGLMPADFRTEDGLHPEYAALYGATEHRNPDYESRTVDNVRAADLTICFGDMTSRGSRLTYRAFRAKVADGKHDPGIHYVRAGWIAIPTNCAYWDRGPAKVAEMIRKMPHEVVNIAGNRESVSPGIGAWVEAFCVECFRLVQEID